MFLPPVLNLLFTLLIIIGWILNILSKIWNSSQYLRFSVKAIVLVNIAFCLEAIRTISIMEGTLAYGKGEESVCLELQQKVKLFRNQRNAYITGFNVFLSLIFYRLFVTMSQMHSWRNDLKEIVREEKQLKKDK